MSRKITRVRGANWLTKTVTPYIANIPLQQTWKLPKDAVKAAVVEMAVQLEKTGTVDSTKVWNKFSDQVKKRCTLKYWTETVFLSLVSSATQSIPSVAEAKADAAR